MASPKTKLRLGEFKLWVSAGDLNGTCCKCGTEPSAEFLGVDPVYPDFKIVCGRCGTYTQMKLRMHPRNLYPLPYRGRKAFDRLRARFGGQDRLSSVKGEWTGLPR